MTDKHAQDKTQIIELEPGEEPPERSISGDEESTKEPKEERDEARQPSPEKGQTDWQTELSQFIQKNPQALWGAGLGSGAGLLKSLLTNEDYLSNVILGGLLGGGLGYGSNQLLSTLSRKTSGERKDPSKDETSTGDLARGASEVGSFLATPLKAIGAASELGAAKKRGARLKRRIENRVLSRLGRINRNRRERGAQPLTPEKLLPYIRGQRKLKRPSQRGNPYRLEEEGDIFSGGEE